MDNARAKRTAFLGILQNDFSETWFVRIFWRKRRNDRLARLSARRIREEFAECRDDRRSLETLRNRKIRYPLSVVEIRGHAVNFLDGMTTQGRIRGRIRGREGWRTPYDVWDSKSNFRSFVNFVCPKSSRLKRIFQRRDDIFSLFGKNLTAKLHFQHVYHILPAKNR